MPNRNFNDQVAPAMPSGGSPPALKGGGKGAFVEKPSFPSAALPGKPQPKDRSGGVTRAKIDPKRIGL
jgi:hypothetical protein